MRLTMPRAGHMQSRSARVAEVRRLCVSVLAPLFCAGCFLVSADAAPATPAPTPKLAHHAPANPPNANPPETAMVYDDAYRTPAKDLQLNLDAERKAEAVARFMHGLMLEDTTDADKAEAEYLRALALDPGNSELSVKVAWDDLRRGDTPAAINLLKDTIKAAPKQPQPYVALGYLYANSLNKEDVAQKYLQQALDLDGSNILAYEYLKDLYKSTNQAAKIPPLLERAAKADSKDATYWLRLAAISIETYLGDDASKGSADDLKKITPLFQKALAAGPDDAEVIDKVADFYVATKQVKEAVPLYQRVLDLDPTQNTARENLARCYIELGDNAKAAEVLEAIIKANPVQPHAYAVLAKIYEDAGEYDKALADYEQSLLVSPSDVGGYENVALLLLQHFNQPAKALPVLVEARRRFPDRPGFGYLLAIAQEGDKQHQQSLTTFEQTELEAENDQPALLSSDFYFHYGATAEQAGLYDKAAQLLKKSLELDDTPESIARTSNYLGYMWVDHGLNVEEAGDLIKRALEIEPDNGMYVDSLGWYYYHTNHFDQALTQLARAVDLIKPDDPTVLEHLGDTYLKLNDTAKAVDCWQKALTLDPTNPNIPQLNKKIADTKTPTNPTPAPPKG